MAGEGGWGLYTYHTCFLLPVDVTLDFVFLAATTSTENHVCWDQSSVSDAYYSAILGRPYVEKCFRDFDFKKYASEQQQHNDREVTAGLRDLVY